MNKFLKYITNSFKYEPKNNYNFTLSTVDTVNNSNDINVLFLLYSDNLLKYIKHF